MTNGICGIQFNSFDCARTIEGEQLQAGVPQIARDENSGQLLLTLSNGDVLTFTDSTKEGPGGYTDYSYRQYLPELNHHLLHVQYYEGIGYLLVDAQMGEQTLIKRAARRCAGWPALLYNVQSL